MNAHDLAQFVWLAAGLRLPAGYALAEPICASCLLRGCCADAARLADLFSRGKIEVQVVRPEAFIPGWRSISTGRSRLDRQPLICQVARRCSCSTSSFLSAFVLCPWRAGTSSLSVSAALALHLSEGRAGIQFATLNSVHGGVGRRCAACLSFLPREEA